MLYEKKSTEIYGGYQSEGIILIKEKKNLWECPGWKDPLSFFLVRKRVYSDIISQKMANTYELAPGRPRYLANSVQSRSPWRIMSISCFSSSGCLLGDCAEHDPITDAFVTPANLDEYRTDS